MHTGSNNRDIRISNRGLILQQIATSSGISRVDIAARMELTKTTVSKVVQELIGQGMVVERETADTAALSSGRPPVQLAISEKAPLICGMLLKRRRTIVMLGTLQGRIIDQITNEYSGLLQPEALIRFLLDSYRELSERHRGMKILGIGISCVGLIDHVSGVILNPPNYFAVPCELPVVSLLREQIPLPIYLMHDTSASVLAEQLYDPENVTSNFAYLTLQAGIGIGFVLDGKVYNGQSGQTGEFGHTSINFLGEPCVCGNRGCLELYANLASMILRLHSYRSAMPEHPLMDKGDIGFADITRCAQGGDGLCAAILREYAQYLGSALVNVINLLDIDLIVLEYEGGPECSVLEGFLEQEINTRIVASKYKTVHIRQSKFRDHLSLVSSIAVAAQHVFDGDL